MYFQTGVFFLEWYMALNHKLSIARKVLISYCKFVTEKKKILKASVSSFGGGIWLDFVSGPPRNTVYTKSQNSAHFTTK